MEADDWSLCADCRTLVYRKRLDRALSVCPSCGRHERLTARQRLTTLLDPSSMELLDVTAAGGDPLGFVDTVAYPDRIERARRSTGLVDAVECAVGTIGGHRLVVAAMDFRFLGGSLGCATGEAITLAADVALGERLPLLLVSASGGARMQEGALSLMQMAKTAQALSLLDEAGLLTVSLVTDPTYGGVAASFATLCDVILAEPRARLGFAGPRVVEQTIRQALPPGFQTAEFLLAHGLVDNVVPRSELRPTLTRILTLASTPAPAPAPDRTAPVPARSDPGANTDVPDRSPHQTDNGTSQTVPATGRTRPVPARSDPGVPDRSPHETNNGTSRTVPATGRTAPMHTQGDIDTDTDGPSRSAHQTNNGTGQTVPATGRTGPVHTRGDTDTDTDADGPSRSAHGTDAGTGRSGPVREQAAAESGGTSPGRASEVPERVAADAGDRHDGDARGPVPVTDPDELDRIDPWTLVGHARDMQRPTTLDYVSRVLDSFQELRGDRLGDDCPAIVGGVGSLAGRPVVVVGHQKGHTPADLTARNFGMPSPAGYLKAARLLRLAAKLRVPVLTLIDTPGAHPGIEAEERGQAQAVAACIRLLSTLPVPVVGVVTGEGGSGGALALGVADHLLMFSGAYYSVISPEGCAAILWNDSGAAARAAQALKLTAPELLRLRVVDGVLPEPEGGTQSDHAAAATRLRAAVVAAFERLDGVPADELLDRRRARFRAFGQAHDALPDAQALPDVHPVPA